MTLRLNEQEEQALNAIKGKLGCGSASATLKKMILEHALVAKQLADTQTRERQATDELRTIRQEVQHYFDNQDNLRALAKPTLIRGRYPETEEGLHLSGDKRHG